MSLDSGRISWRLNHVDLPDPGSPIASTTTPLLGRAAAATAGGAAPAAGTSSDSGAATGTSDGTGAASATADPFLGVAPGLRRLLRPPRRRRRRFGRSASAGAPGATGATSRTAGMGASGSAKGSAAGSRAGFASASFSKYFGCKGSGALPFSRGELVPPFLRRFRRSLTHLRIQLACSTPACKGAIGPP